MKNCSFIKPYVVQKKPFQMSLTLGPFTREVTILKRSKRIIENFEHKPAYRTGKAISDANCELP